MNDLHLHLEDISDETLDALCNDIAKYAHLEAYKNKATTLWAEVRRRQEAKDAQLPEIWLCDECGGFRSSEDEPGLTLKVSTFDHCPATRRKEIHALVENLFKSRGYRVKWIPVL